MLIHCIFRGIIKHHEMKYKSLDWMRESPLQDEELQENIANYDSLNRWFHVAKVVIILLTDC